MASTLQELRKAAGFKSAKEFGAQMGIPLATYARYESTPERIPLQSAWALADRLGCSIDLIVGRAGLDSESGGRVQAAYDGLSPRLKESLDDYLAFLIAKNADEERRRQDAEDRRYDVISARLEQVFLAGVDDGASDLSVFSSPEAVRSAFREYVESRAGKRREPEVEGSVEKIMQAYDRAHGSFDFDGAGIAWRESGTASPDIEYCMVPLGDVREGGDQEEPE